MTTRKALKAGEQLRLALMFLFNNQENTLVKDIKFSYSPNRFDYQVKVKDIVGEKDKSFPFFYYVDVRGITEEIVKIFREVAVTSCQVSFHSRAIWFIAMELGKVGTYSFFVSFSC